MAAFELTLAFEPVTPPPAAAWARGGLVLRFDADEVIALETPTRSAEPTADWTALELERVALDPEGTEAAFAGFGAI